MTTAFYKQYEVGTGTTGQSWSNAQWRPRQDDAWPTANKIGYNPDACKLINFQGTPAAWIDHTSTKMPAQVKCEFDPLEINEILSNSNEIRRYIYKYQPDESKAALKSHCSQMVTVNGQQIPRYLHPSDTFCKSAIVGEDYKTFVHDICSNNISAPYCACYNRSNDHVYVVDGNVIPDEYAVCWYKPCVFNTGFKDPRLTSTCETNICQLGHVGSEVSICN